MVDEHHSGVGGPLAESTNEGIRALRIGVAGLALTAAAQTALLLVSGSVALLGDTLHNGVDVAATAVVWLAFVISRRDRTEGFSFGFHRVEDLASLIVVLLIAGGAGLVVYESVTAFGEEQAFERPVLVLLAGVVGLAGNEGVAQYKIRVGRRIGSGALIADGRHSRADGLTSGGVIAAAVGLMLGAGWLDATVGLFIGVLIAREAVVSGRDTLLRLLDHSDGETRQALVKIAAAIDGIEHVNELRVRRVGRISHVVASVCIPAEVTFARAHDITEELRHAWVHALPPGSVVDIHADPYSPGEAVPHLVGPEHGAA
jgi:cation diffusion facilitator family transporter